MVSSNNPTPSATTAQPTPPPAEAVNTQVEAGGQAFELRNISVANGMRLYQALPPQKRAEADQISNVVMTFYKVQQAATKYHVDPTELAQNWIRTGNDTAARNALPPEQKQAIQELSNDGIQVRQLAHMVPGGDAMMGAADTASGLATVTGAAASITGAAIDGTINGPSRVWGALSVMGGEAWGHIFGYGGGTPDDAAKVFGAATVALRMSEHDQRHAQGIASQLWNNPLQYAGAAFGTLGDWLAQHIPGVQYIMAAYKWVTAPSEGKLTYSQYVEQANTEIQQGTQNNPADFSHLGQNFSRHADDAMYNREGDHVRASLEAATTIAGMPTQGLATAVTATQVTYRDQHGVDTTLDHGHVQQQVTSGQRIQNAGHAIVGDGPWYEQGARGGAAGLGIGLVANGARGAAEGVVAHHITAPAHAAEKATARANTLDGHIARAEAGQRVRPWHVRKPDAAAVDALHVERDAARATAVTRGQEAAQHTAHAGPFTHTATTPVKEINAAAKAASEHPGLMGKWMSVWNAPRAVGRWVGNTVAGAAEGAKNAVFGILPGARHYTEGFVQGVDHVVNSRPGKTALQEAATALEGAGRLTGKVASHTVKFLDPLIEGVETVRDIGRGDTAGWSLRGAGTAAMAGVIVKLTARRAIPWLSPIMDTSELGYSAAHHDTGGMIRSGTSLGTTAAGAGIGAAIGVWFFGVGALPGAAIGATIGGIAGIFTGPTAEHYLTPKAPAPAAAASHSAAQPTPPALTQEQLVAAHEGVIAQARMTLNRGTAPAPRPVAFNLGLRTNHMGAVHANGLPNPAGSAAPQAQQTQRA